MANERYSIYIYLSIYLSVCRDVDIYEHVSIAYVEIYQHVCIAYRRAGREGESRDGELLHAYPSIYISISISIYIYIDNNQVTVTQTNAHTQTG